MTGAFKHLQRRKDFWDGFVRSQLLTGVFQFPENQLKNRPYPDDDLPKMAKCLKMTYRK
jgi:hypothetical protein